jgi:hypothetical protein
MDIRETGYSHHHVAGYRIFVLFFPGAGSIPGRGNDFSLYPGVQTSSVAYPVDTGVKRPGRQDNRSPPLSIFRYGMVFRHTDTFTYHPHRGFSSLFRLQGLKLPPQSFCRDVLGISSTTIDTNTAVSGFGFQAVFQMFSSQLF